MLSPVVSKWASQIKQQQTVLWELYKACGRKKKKKTIVRGEELKFPTTIRLLSFSLRDYIFRFFCLSLAIPSPHRFWDWIFFFFCVVWLWNWIFGLDQSEKTLRVAFWVAGSCNEVSVTYSQGYVINGKRMEQSRRGNQSRPFHIWNSLSSFSTVAGPSDLKA